ncbi:MAG: DUF4296 domain-containing protein [Flavipsychrobacter sp.]
MKQFLFYFLCLVVLVACEPKEQPAPVSKEQMQQILTDINYAEVYSTMVNDSLQQIMNKNKDSLAVYYNTILTHHGITMDELIESFSWYQKHPDVLEAVYQDMIPDITTQQDLLDVKQNN